MKWFLFLSIAFLSLSLPMPICYHSLSSLSLRLSLFLSPHSSLYLSRCPSVAASTSASSLEPQQPRRHLVGVPFLRRSLLANLVLCNYAGVICRRRHLQLPRPSLNDEHQVYLPLHLRHTVHTQPLQSIRFHRPIINNSHLVLILTAA